MYLKIVGNFLLLPTGGKGIKSKRYPTIKARLTEVPPAGFGEVAISRDARGTYYASFSYVEQEAEPQRGQVVAFDLGIKTLATGVNEQGRVYTCKLSGKELLFLDESATSKTCHVCGAKQDMPLYQRMYRCECGLIMDRDENSAHNILMRFLARLGPHVADATRCADVFTATEYV
jgi:transposase